LRARRASGDLRRARTPGELLLTLAARKPQHALTREQIEDLKLAIKEADRGEFATDSDMNETWKKLGL
jgi:hypothetical protein